MPRNVRNFWIDAQVDGRTSVATGPAAKDGGISIRIRQRQNGAIIDALRIDGFAMKDGELVLRVYNPADETVGFNVTTRR